MKQLSAIFAVLLLAVTARAQHLTGLATRWNDSFTEWIIYTDTEGQDGELRQRWQGQDDWTEWQYRLGESTGNIRLKWGDNPNEWEARGDNAIISARTVWNGNFREWRISDGSYQLTLSCRYGNTFDEWAVRSSNAGEFNMYTNWEGDPRDWAITDDLDENVPLPMRVLTAFIVAFHSTPKE